jgi:hypothetical protein
MKPSSFHAAPRQRNKLNIRWNGTETLDILPRPSSKRTHTSETILNSNRLEQLVLHDFFRANETSLHARGEIDHRKRVNMRDAASILVRPGREL